MLALASDQDPIDRSAHWSRNPNYRHRDITSRRANLCIRAADRRVAFKRSRRCSLFALKPSGRPSSCAARGFCKIDRTSLASVKERSAMLRQPSHERERFFCLILCEADLIGSKFANSYRFLVDQVSSHLSKALALCQNRLISCTK